MNILLWVEQLGIFSDLPVHHSEICVDTYAVRPGNTCISLAMLKSVNIIFSLKTMIVKFILLLLIVAPAFAEEPVNTFELDEEVQQALDIKTITLEKKTLSVEIASYGKVLDISPLISFRQQYLQTEIDLSAARAQLNISEQALNRLKKLQRENISSTKKLQQQLRIWQADRARVSALTLKRDGLSALQRIQWGAELTDWFSQQQSASLKALLIEQAHLFEIRLPENFDLQNPPEKLVIAPGQKKYSIHIDQAFLSPVVDPLSQTRRYFFISANERLQPNLTFNVWLADKRSQQSGLVIPKSALLWHLGQAFVYAKEDEDEFHSVVIKDYQPNSAGYWVLSGLEEGMEIVVQGGQALLSYEFKAQIPDDDDD